MARRSACLIASDEEDEDGNLCEAASSRKNKSVPAREVVYLPDDTSGFQPEDEASSSTVKEQNKLSGPSIKVKSIDSMKIKSEELKKSFEANKLSSNIPNATSTEKSIAENTSKKEETIIKHDANSNLNKTKYTRQATPLCDYIMKEYSKQQKEMKLKGKTGSVKLNDMPIKELLRKAKEAAELQKSGKTNSPTNQIKDTIKINEPSTEEKASDPLCIVKQEIIDIKPEVIYDPVKLNDEKAEVSNNSIKTNQTSSRGRGKPRGRGRPSNRVVNQKKRKWTISDDDTDEDPDFDPSKEVKKSLRITRSSRRTTINQKSKTQVGTSDAADVSQLQVHTPYLQDNDVSNSQDKHMYDCYEPASNLENNSIPKEKALDVAVRLKTLAEKIANVLTKEPSPNINSETEKLLQTTQELIEIQKKNLLNSEKVSQSNQLPLDTVKIKQEVTDEHVNSMIPQRSTDDKTNKTPVQSQYSAKNSLQINDQLNQLQRHEAALQRKLSETHIMNKNSSNTMNTTIHTDLSNVETSGPLTVQKKCSFILDFFTSYQAVFDKTIVTIIIPTLTDSIMLCVAELTQCIQRIKTAESLKSEDLKREEVNLAKQAYLKTVMNAGCNFFPLFTSVIKRIMETKTSIALVNTLILYLAGSLFMKTPTLGNHIHKLRRVLLFMTKAHQHHWLPVNQVLQLPNDVFDSESKLLRQMLKYFHARKFIEIPAELLCTYPDVSKEEEQQFQAEISIMDSDILMKINPIKIEATESLDANEHLKTLATSDLSRINQSDFSSSTEEFEVALQRLKDGNTKRIEQKLDYILNVLSVGGFGNTVATQKSVEKTKVEQLRGKQGIRNLNVTVNLGKRVSDTPTVKLNSTVKTNAESSTRPGPSTGDQRGINKDVLLAEFLQNDHVGLDSLFSSYLKSRTEGSGVKVKLEPVDVFQETPDVSSNFVSFPVKQEPIEQMVFEDAAFNDSFTEDFTKAEEDF